MVKIRNMMPYLVVIAFMVGVIPFVQNDYVLTGIYVAIAAFTIGLKHEHDDYFAYFFGLVALTIFEYFFISTGVETFTRTTLLGVMPLWLPFLWAYAFLAIKRVLRAP